MVNVIILLSVTVLVLAVLVALLILHTQSQSNELREKNRVIVREVQRRSVLVGRMLSLLALLCAVVQGVCAQSYIADNKAQQVSANPEAPVCYIECSWDEDNKAVENQIITVAAGDYTTLSSSQGNVELTAGTYVVSNSCTVNSLVCKGQVKLILCDDVQLTVKNAIRVNNDDGASIYIYSQSYGSSMGKVRATIETDSGYKGCGIGSSMQKAPGRIEIHGGDIYAVANQDGGAGIGCGAKANGEAIVIYGGNIYAHGGNKAAGIGSGRNADGLAVTIRGGYVYAKGGVYGAGIGSGNESSVSLGVQGGNVTITGGEVYAYGGTDAAGIGGGEDADGGTVNISDANVYAQGSDWGAGIGGGQGGDGGNVTITSGTVIAKAGRNEIGSHAIGPGESSDNYGSLTIGDEMMVRTSNFGGGWTDPYAANSRRDVCWYRTRACIEPCDHQDHTYIVDGTNIYGTHTEECENCTTQFDPEQHIFVDNVCTVCGTIQTDDDETGIREVKSENSTGAWYTLDGRVVGKGNSSNRKLPKGVYIVNGKRVAIK